VGNPENLGKLGTNLLSPEPLVITVFFYL
jgi:hypothetical protein